MIRTNFIHMFFLQLKQNCQKIIKEDKSSLSLIINHNNKKINLKRKEKQKMNEKRDKKLISSTSVDELINEVGSCGLFHLKQILKMLNIATMSAITIYVTIFNIADQKLTCHMNQQKVNDEEKVFLFFQRRIYWAFSLKFLNFLKKGMPNMVK